MPLVEDIPPDPTSAKDSLLGEMVRVAAIKTATHLSRLGLFLIITQTLYYELAVRSSVQVTNGAATKEVFANLKLRH